MTRQVLIAEEVRTLLDPSILEEFSLDWIGSDEPTPRAGYQAVMPLLTRKIGPAELDSLPNLRVLANIAVGYDNIDVLAAQERGCVVTNTPDVLTESTADLAWLLILAAARRAKEGFLKVWTDQWVGWHPTDLLGMELRGRVLGLIGAGRIGQAVGARAVGFGMTLRYTARAPKPDFEGRFGAQFGSLEDVVSTADVVSIHLPLRSETKGLFDHALLSLMKPGAILVNTARGGIVDEKALVDSLDAGTLAGAGLDVFEREPVVQSELKRHPRVFCLPHMGSGTWDTRRAMVNLAARNVAAVLKGEPPLTPVIVDRMKGGS